MESGEEAGVAPSGVGEEEEFMGYADSFQEANQQSMPSPSLNANSGSLDPFSFQQQSEQSQALPVFSCKLDNVQVLIDVLTSITLEKGPNQLVIINAAPAGLKLVTEASRVCQAKAYIKSAVFSEYSVVDDCDEGVDFTVPLHLLQTCLTMFDAHRTRLEMSYNDAMLAVLMENEGVITQCELKTQVDPVVGDFDFRTSETAARAHIKSSYLLACLQELDVPGGTLISITFDVNEPHLSMSVKGDFSDIKVDFPPSKDTDVFLDFECKQSVTFQYPLNWIKASAKALSKASQSNVRVNEEGMLVMTHVLLSNDTTNWVELKICAQDIL